jgi:predicted phage terminase large subunit-like protein
MKQKIDKINKILKEYAKKSPALFAFYTGNKKFRFPKHIRILNKLLLDISSRKFKRLIVNMPPRHGKSELITGNYPVWYIGNNPSHRVIVTCYCSHFAETFGRKGKNLFLEFGKSIFNLELNPFSKSSRRFDINKHTGGIDFVGVSGAITGKGADLYIIDDPIKNDAEAHSAHQRDKLWDWFNSTAYTRLEPNGIMIVVMTRWHEDDLCGRIKENNQVISLKDYLANNETLSDDLWVIASFPALAIENDELGRSEGQALWSGKYPQKTIRSIEKNIGSYRFAGLYQQSPLPAKGNIFKRMYFRYFIENDEFFILKAFNNDKETKRVIPKSDCINFAVCDLAVTKKETSDYTVILIYSVTPKNDILIRDIIRDRYEGANHKELILSVHEKWKPSIIGIESVQYQTALTQIMQNTGLAIKALKPDKEKVMRSLPMQVRLEGGKVYFLDKAHWLDDFEKELIMFPNARHDDQVDAFSYIAYMTNEIGNVTPKGAKLILKKEGITSNYI